MLELNFHASRGDFHLRAAARLDGQAVGVTGPSGAGKTTLLSALAGLLRPTTGRIALDGQVLFDSARKIDVPPHKRRIGMVFQDLRLFPHYTVRENLLYGRRFAPAGQGRIELDEAAAMLELEDFLARPAESLSGGQKQRVALGRALLASPRLLLLDEPLASLDGRLRRHILPYLDRVRRFLDVPLIFVSHRLDEVLAVADRLLLVDDGEATELAMPSPRSVAPSFRFIRQGGLCR